MTFLPNPLGRSFGAPRTYRRALITGATSGIGAAFAQALPAATDLLLNGRNEEALVAAGFTGASAHGGDLVHIVEAVAAPAMRV